MTKAKAFKALKTVSPGLRPLCEENSSGEWVLHCAGFKPAWDNGVDIYEDGTIWFSTHYDGNWANQKI